MLRHDQLQHLHQNQQLLVEPAIGSIPLVMSRWVNRISRRHVLKYLPPQLLENNAANLSDQVIAVLGTSVMSVDPEIIARVVYVVLADTENGNAKASIMVLLPIALVI